jgi:chemotaxis response regulator CheB
MKAHPDIVAIGASSGGIEALQSLFETLSDLDAIVLVVLHRSANRASYLRDCPAELRKPLAC